MKIFKKLIECSNTNEKIRISIYYEKSTKQYTVVVVPVTVTKGERYNIEEFGAYTGFKEVIHEVGRRSAKQDQVAIDLMWNAWKDKYINKLKEMGYKIVEPEIV